MEINHVMMKKVADSGLAFCDMPSDAHALVPV